MPPSIAPGMLPIPPITAPMNALSPATKPISWNTLAEDEPRHHAGDAREARPDDERRS